MEFLTRNASLRDSGVSTVLVKLFNLIKPDIALFGERDFQQLVIVRRLVDDLFLSIEVVGCATWTPWPRRGWAAPA